MRCWTVIIVQIVKGSKADTVARLPTISGANPRSWVFSTSGKNIAVGYVQGSLQVSDMTNVVVRKLRDVLTFLACPKF